MLLHVHSNKNAIAECISGGVSEFAMLYCVLRAENIPNDLAKLAGNQLVALDP